MTVQILNYGACIRLVTDNSVLMLAKSQIVNIEVIRDDTVKINIGEGPLKEILIKLVEVTQPAGLLDVAALRDAITHMLDYSNNAELEALQKQQLQINELIEIKQLFTLWHSSLLTDLNFQQLQVNGLVSINNRLLETKEDNQAMLDNQRDQTIELRNQTVVIASQKVLLELIQGYGATQVEKLSSIDTVVAHTDGITQTIAVSAEQQRSVLMIHTSIMGEMHSKLEAIRLLNSDIVSKVSHLDAIHNLQTDALGKLTTIANTLIETNVRQLDMLSRLDSLILLLGNLTPPDNP
jgi:hypothetical protein